MSALRSTAAARPLPRTGRPGATPAPRPTLTALPGGATERGARSRLELVRAPLHARSRVPFLVVCMSVLGLALLCALLVNTTMAQNSYEMSGLRREVGQVEQDTQRLQALVRDQEAALHDTARRYGMVESPAPGMIRLADGAVVLGAEEGAGQ
ncbi:hypothetical protein [Cellulosimicrobium sp. CUA-896]|uniref:hypothetical protein n=1 Tax=Cellulosimicrobium sp. CUA-896 TaxID=1517881 RepID=UPI00095EF37E|nr:hypothetical protein [Cellulosimicrobium sp. CUA-896]OLT46780.1 hypothetical protein BJF88_04015 [Cellulosimicrobium sp. CUA-896]